MSCCSTPLWRGPVSILECYFLQVPCVCREVCRLQLAPASSLGSTALQHPSALSPLSGSFALPCKQLVCLGDDVTSCTDTCSRSAELVWVYGLELNWPSMVSCTCIEICSSPCRAHFRESHTSLQCLPQLVVSQETQVGLCCAWHWAHTCGVALASCGEITSSALDAQRTWVLLHTDLLLHV